MQKVDIGSDQCRVPYGLVASTKTRSRLAIFLGLHSVVDSFRKQMERTSVVILVSRSSALIQPIRFLLSISQRLVGV